MKYTEAVSLFCWSKSQAQDDKIETLHIEELPVNEADFNHSGFLIGTIEKLFDISCMLIVGVDPQAQL